MKRREYIGRFLGDLAKIVFGTVIIGQIVSNKPDIYLMISGTAVLIIFLSVSILIIPEDDDGK